MPANSPFRHPVINPPLQPIYAITAAAYDKPFVPQRPEPATVDEPYLLARDWQINVGSIGDLGNVTVAQTNQVGAPFELILLVSIFMPSGYNFDPYAYNPPSGGSAGTPSLPVFVSGEGTPNYNVPQRGGVVVETPPGPTYEVTLQTPSPANTHWYAHASIYRFVVPGPGASITLPVCIAAAADLATFRAYEQRSSSNPDLVTLTLYPAAALKSTTPPFEFSGKPLAVKASEYEYNADQGLRKYFLL